VAIETEEEAEALPRYGKLGVVAQTTFSVSKFKQIAERLIDKSNDIKYLRTICTATDQRQASAIKLAGEVDLMLVIGGKNSANTTRLAQLCSDKCKTYHIETADELRDEWFDKIKKNWYHSRCFYAGLDYQGGL
jgi:4-hydroxy-3-methylbut-2-enyl diphosphate reductase